MSKLTNKQKEKIAKGKISIEELQAVIPGWTIISHLGKGGTGIVYNIINCSTGQNAVLKINARFGNSQNDMQRQQRFELEIDILNQLKLSIKNNELCIIEILDNYRNYQNENENFQWYVVKKGDGVTTHLKSKLNESSSPYDFLRYIINNFIDLFNTLDYLHNNSIAHRDIKPDNLVFNHISQKFVFIDFGIAKTYESSFSKITENNEKDKFALGPKITMPPEMENDPANSDPYKADVYSLTKTMYLFIKCYHSIDYCFKGQFNIEHHHYKDSLIERYNELHNANEGDFLTFSAHKQLGEFIYLNTHDEPTKRMTAKESCERLEHFLEFITPIDWASKKDALYGAESEYNYELKTYIRNVFGGDVQSLAMIVNNFKVDDYYFLKFLNESKVSKKIKDNIEVNNIKISYQSKNLLFADDNRIKKITWQIEKYHDKDNETYYFIKAILESKNNVYIYEYDSCFIFI